MLHCNHNLFLAAQFSYRKEKRGEKQRRQDTQRPLLTWRKRTNVLFFEDTILPSHPAEIQGLPCHSPCIIFFFGGTMVILKENQVSLFFTLIETEERGPIVYTEKLATGTRTRCVPPGCNTAFFLSAARSPFLIRPSVLSQRLKLTGSSAFALSLRRLVSARIHQVAFSRRHRKCQGTPCAREQYGWSGLRDVFQSAKKWQILTHRWNHGSM